MTRPTQIAITGAAGQIGYALAFRIAAGGLFGAEHPVALSLLESADRLDLARAMQMELKDCAFPLLHDVRATGDAVEAFTGAEWVVMLAGRPQRAGERRVDLLRDNAPIYVSHGRALNEAAPDARILTVANPCNTLCMIAQTHAPNIPVEHWFAMTHLDRMRTMAILAEKAGVPVTEVCRVTVWGNHTESIFPDIHNAWVAGRPAPEVIGDPNWAHDVLEPLIAHRSEELIKLRGASPAGSAAQAVITSLRSISTPTPHERWFCAGVRSDGSYGVPGGLIFSFPLRTEDGKTWSIVQDLYVDEHTQSHIGVNVAELEHEAAAVSDLLSGDF